MDAALALAFETQLEGSPSYPHIETLPERHAGIERQVGIRTLEVRVHLHFRFLARLVRHHDPSLIAFRVPIISNDGSTRGLRLDLIEAIRSRGFLMRATPQRRCACWW